MKKLKNMMIQMKYKKVIRKVDFIVKIFYLINLYLYTYF